MPNLTIINLNPGDTQEDLINKINQNFDAIVANGGGPQGVDGKQGNSGPVGPEGPMGDTGVPGERGTRWFLSPFAPNGGSTPNLQILIGDYWVNTNVSDNKSVSVYTSSGWSLTGQNLQAQEIFKTLVGITGPSTTSLKNAIVQSSSTPGSNTFVLSDINVDTGNANPSYSKFLIATNQSNGFPLLEFAKSNLVTGLPSEYNKHPYFAWKNPTAPDYGIRLVSPADSLDVVSAKNLNLQSTNGDVTVSGISASLTANTSMSFTTSGLMDLNSGTSNLLINSNQFTLNGTSALFRVPISISGSFSGVSMASFVNSGSGGGISVNLTGAVSTSRFLANFLTTSTTGTTTSTTSRFYVRSDGKIKFDKTLYAYSTSTKGAPGDYQANVGKFYYIVGPNVITNGNVAMVDFVTGTTGAGIAIPLTPGPTGFSDLIGVGESYQMTIFSSATTNTLSGISLTTNGTSSLMSDVFAATPSVSISIIRLTTSSWRVYYDTPSVSGILSVN
jgi:hypothetical protein